jgi:arylsulfatase A-like enzyme
MNTCTQTRYIDPLRGKGPFTVERDETACRAHTIFISVDMVPMEFHQPVTGHVQPRTPTLDRLRADGVNFQNAFSTSPLCSPSRASYLTGRYSYITGNSERSHDGHEIHLRDEDTLWSEYLKADGSHMRHVGKSHVGTHKFIDVFSENDSPWNRWSPPWYDEDAYIQFLRSKGLGPLEFGYSLYGTTADGRGRGNFYGGYIADQQGRPFPKDATYPAFLVQKAVTALETRQSDAPLYLQLDFFGPHQPFAIPGGMEERARELRESVEVPASYKALFSDEGSCRSAEPRIYSLYRKNWGLTDPEVVREYRIANILQYELIDECIGTLMQALEDHGMYDTSWIYFAADHGEMNGEMGLIDKGAYLNPRVLRVPLIVKAPAERTGLWKPGTNCITAVSLLDIAPTILGEAGITTAERLDGIPLTDSLSAAQRPAQKPIMCDIWNHVMPNPAVGTVFTTAAGEQRFYTYNMTDPLDELYDLESGSELHNLLADGSEEVAEAVGVMAGRLSQDPRWEAYSSYIQLEYDHILGARGDNQKFIS